MQVRDWRAATARAIQAVQHDNPQSYHCPRTVGESVSRGIRTKGDQVQAQHGREKGDNHWSQMGPSDIAC